MLLEWHIEERRIFLDSQTLLGQGRTVKDTGNRNGFDTGLHSEVPLHVKPSRALPFP